jgi:GT2 family glycosyltransferase
MDTSIWKHYSEEMDELIKKRYAAFDTLDRGQDTISQTESDFMSADEDHNKIEELMNENDSLRMELSRIYNSRGWRFLRLLYRLRDTLLPLNSIRRKIVKKLFKGLLFVKRSIKNLNNKNIKKFAFNTKTYGLKYTLKKTLRYTEKYPGGKPKDEPLQEHQELREEVISAINELSDEISYELLQFDRTDNPLVSIIIPVFNQWSYTYNCLKSILTTSEKCSYEIIIADDGSTDETLRLDSILKNITHIKNETNLGFLRNCNHAALAAKGKYILFLNNDTIVLENWLSSLIELMENDITVGLAGSKFIYPDGSLQEAGGIIWNDASGANYGRGRDPFHAEYNYVKEVDYISGASMMVRKELWELLGGFDERYAPAYSEDSDLCFEIRRLGYRVVYQPKSALIHFERVSHGDSKETGAWKGMEENRQKFIEKWGEVLKKDHFAPFTNMYLARDRSMHRKKILFIDDRVPMWDQHAGAKTAYNFLKLLVDLGFQVTFIGDNDYHHHQPYTSILQQMGIEVIYGQWYMDNDKKWLSQVARYFDFIFLNRPHIGEKYLDFFHEQTKAPVIYYGHDLHHLREMRQYELTGDKDLLKQAQKSKQTELGLMAKADIVFSVSPFEKAIIDKELGIDRTIVTPIFFYKDFSNEKLDIKNKKGLLFVGGYGHTPNIDGAKWFVSEILPIIRKIIPDIKLTLAGSNPTNEVLSLASSNVRVTGFLTDEELNELYKTSRVCVIPLRFGAGVKGKTVDAMYNRMAIVSTSIGIEGLDGIGDYLQPFDDAESFAAEVVRLYNDDAEIAKAFDKNINYIKEHLSYEQALALFENVFGKGEKK